MKVRIILNIVADEKFIDDMITCHDMSQLPTHRHLYAIIGKKNSEDLRYISNVERIIFIKSRDFISFLDKECVDAVFLHSLFVLPINLIPIIPERVKVFWFSWGYDIYRNSKVSLIDNEIYHEKTRDIMNRIGSRVTFRFDDVVRYVRGCIYQRKNDRWYPKAVKRVDYYSGVLPIEYDLCKKKDYFRASSVEYKYFSYKTFSDVSEPQVCTGKNIIVGNSAAYENNHLDVFQYMETLDFRERKIYLPLSYSGEKEYVRIIRENAYKKWGDVCCLLEKYMAFDAYRSILQSCNVGIFFHERQQALGNIIMLLLQGGKVFLSETSIVYAHFKQLGVKVYSVQSELTQKEIDTELDEEIKIENITRLNVGRSKRDYSKMMEQIYSLI